MLEGKTEGASKPSHGMGEDSSANGGWGRKQIGILCVDPDPNTVERWVSAFLMRQPFNTVPHAELSPTIKLFSSLLYNCSFATIVNHNVNTSADGLWGGCHSYRLRTTVVENTGRGRGYKGTRAREKIDDVQR